MRSFAAHVALDLHPRQGSVTCPPHYSPNTHAELPAPCLPSCPSEIYTEAETDRFYYIFEVVGVITIVFGVYALIPLAGDRYYWSRMLRHSIAGTIICAYVTACGFVVPLFLAANEWEDVVCTDQVTYATQSHSLCGLQAVIISYWSTAGTYWWAIMIGSLIAYVHKVDLDTWPATIIIHAFAWLVPALTGLTVELTLENYGGQPGFPVCGHLGKDHGWLTINFFYIPNMVVAILGGLGWVYLMFKLIKDHGFHGLLLRIRLLLFMAAYLLTNTYGDILYFSLRSEEDETEHTLSQWYTCLARLASQDDGPCEYLRDPPSYPALLVATILGAFSPISFIIALGTTRRVWHWWRLCFRGVLRCDWAHVRHWWDDLRYYEEYGESKAENADEDEEDDNPVTRHL